MSVPPSEDLLIAMVEAGMHRYLTNGGGSLVRSIFAEEMAPLVERIATIEGHQTAALAAQKERDQRAERRHRVLITVIAGTFGVVGPLVLLLATQLTT